MSAPKIAPFDALTVPLDPGVTLVEASAGTGKTFAITRLLLRLLLENAVDDLSKILVVTFTEKATQELVTRIRDVLRVSNAVWSDHPPDRSRRNEDLFRLRDRFGAPAASIIEHALHSLDDLGVSTIHGFCYRMLAESALESRIPFRTTFLEDDTEPLERAANDWARKNLLNDSERAQIVVDGGTAPAQWVPTLVRPYRRFPGTRIDFNHAEQPQELLADFVLSVDRGFEEEKVRRHLLGFDDLLRKLCDVLTKEGPDGSLARRIRSTFSAALIDEFQDTDPTQYPIFSTAFAGCPLFLIGDPKQSIYAFRGADVHAYLDAAAAASRRYTLPTNYRSTPGYVKAVQHLFTRGADPFVVPSSQIGFPVVQPATGHEPPAPLATDGRASLEWWWIDGSLGLRGRLPSKEVATHMAVREVVNEIVRLSDAGLPCGRMAVLLRTNAQARLVKKELERARIPAVTAGDVDVLASDEGAELVQLAAAIAAPNDGRIVHAALATRLWGCTAGDIARLWEDGAEAEWKDVLDRFLKARAQWWRRGVALALGELLAGRQAMERLLALPEGERRVTNVRHVLELFHEAWMADGIAPEGFAAWIARERSVPNTPERRELRLERDAEAVQVLTIHKCKGLEFDVVFCPTLWDVTGSRKGPLDIDFALAREKSGRVLDLGSERVAERRAARDNDDRAEAVRLAYVALTRAVHRCYVAWGEIGQGNSAADSALGWLLRPENDKSARDVLATLVGSSGGTMHLSDLAPDGRYDRAHARAAPPRPPEARRLALRRDRLETWHITSYTALAAGGSADDARDVEDPIAVPLLLGRPEEASGFRGFPAGAAAGVALHALLEEVDFQQVDDAGLTELVRRTLASHGLLAPASRRVPDVSAMVRDLARATIPEAGFTVHDVPRDAGMREWRFDLSLRQFSVDRLADALERFGSAHARAYAPRLRRLEPTTVSGYLSGYVDLTFAHDARWWIFDWKSNWLGAADSQYAPDVLETAMWEEHYTLQYHLYMVALHRHLRARLRDYDPARHWGGVAYVFLRGIDAGDETGWFRDTPTPALLDALDDALGRRA